MDTASVSIRLNPFKGLDGPGGAPVPWSPCGRILESRPQFIFDPLMHAGCYYVQDSSAMFVGHVFRRELGCLGVAEGLRVLDLCAAPGGKTTDLAASLREAAGDGFTLVSNEVMRARASVLCDNVAIWGDPAVTVTSVDPAVIGRTLPGWFDIIVADVPCSGEGMFRKDPRAREEWSPAVVDLCAARQKRILADVWPALREGGILIYSTCTYEDAENDANLRWAASELGGELLPPEEGFGSYGVRTTDCGNLLHDGEVPGEGQWVGALRKTAPAPSRPGLTPSSLRPLRSGLSDTGNRTADGNRSPVRQSPTPVILSGAKDLKPDPDTALSIFFDKSTFPCVDVDLKTALHFLHRDTLSLPDAPRGYNVITYRGHPLGFVKNLGNRCNNLHPLARRIIKDII